MFDKNAVNGVTKKLFTISKNYKIATNVKSLFTVNNNRVLGAYTNKTIIEQIIFLQVYISLRQSVQ